MTLLIVGCQAPLPWGFSRKEYCSGLPCPPPGDLPNPGIKRRSPSLEADSLPSEPPGNSLNREWQPAEVLLPGESCGQRSLASYSPWGHKELDMTEHTQRKKHLNKEIFFKKERT